MFSLWPAVAVAATLVVGCGDFGYRLQGGDAAGESGGSLDDAAGGDDALGEADASLDDGADETWAGCPIFAIAEGAGGPEDGSREHPHVGLQRALDARGSCPHVLLVVSATGAAIFDLGVDIEVGTDEYLILEGDPSAASRPSLEGHGAAGMRAWGEGTLVLRNLDLSGGSSAQGGCLDARVRRLVLDGTRWTACRSAGDGGAVAVDAADVLVESSEFRDNSAGGSGGGLVLDGWLGDAAMRVVDSSFYRNEARLGGAVALKLLTLGLSVEETLFSDNVASVEGGAVSGGLAGRLAGNRFERNVSGPGGGAVSVSASARTGVVERNVFVANVRRGAATRDPGLDAGTPALDVHDGYVLVRNNLFLRNVAEMGSEADNASAGAAAFHGSGRPVVVNNTFVDNVNEPGPAHLAGWNLDVRANIFAGGAGAFATAVEVAGDSTGVEFNDVWDFDGPPFFDADAVGRGNLAEDPLFVAAGRDDYRLAAGSPCLDAGDPDDVYRDVDATRNDIGAFGGPAGDWLPLEGDE